MQTIVLTAEGLEKAQKELNERLSRQKEIIERIDTAREFGDLRENAEYQTAQEQRNENDARIAELRHIIKFAQIFDPGSTKTNDQAHLGSRVLVKNDTGIEREFTIVGSHEAKPSEGRISNESPLGSALLGKQIGDTVTIESGQKSVLYSILKIG